MTTHNTPAIIPTPLTVALSSTELQGERSSPMPVHVARKIARAPYRGEQSGYESLENFMRGVSHVVITSPDDIANAFQPILEKVGDLSGVWRMQNLAVVGGFYCTLGKNNEIRDKTGIIIPPSRHNPYGTVDIAKAPNGLLYILLLQNMDGRQQQVLYFDPRYDIKFERINPHTRISFASGPKAPNLQLFADVDEQKVGGFMSRRKALFAKKPVGTVACYLATDLAFN